MNLVTFVRNKRPQWQRLEVLLGRIETSSVQGFDREMLRELSQLYRSCTSDLAFAQTYYQGTSLTLFLHQLVSRAHHQIYRTEGLTLGAMREFVRFRVPAAARANVSMLILSAIVFFSSFVLGLVTVQADERMAALVVPAPILEDIYAGHMWTQNVFSAVPASVASTMIFSNNISVALLAFVGGMLFGAGSFFILMLNGFIVGAVFRLCASYGLLPGLMGFVASHGFLEISAIITASAAGFVLAGGILHPGNHSRRDALSVRGLAAAQLALGCVPALIAAGLVEGFVSPADNLPTWFKVMFGLILAAAFWAYLLFCGKRKQKSI
jgi:uncharacterized membrane protein SpoIIM required for sporulation